MVFDFFTAILYKLAEYEIAGLPFIYILIGGIGVSIVFNVFWKGAKG